MKTFYRIPATSDAAKSTSGWIWICLCLLGLAGTVIVIACDTVAPGLEALFMLPLSLTIACLAIKQPVSDAKDSFGLLILYMLLVLRYLVSPVLTALSGRLVPGVSTSAAGLRYAVFIMILELAVVVITINLIWKPVPHSGFTGQNNAEFRLTWIGASVCIALIGVVLVRGRFPNVIEHLSIGKNYAFAPSPLSTYDMSAVLTIKAFLFIAVTSSMSKKYHMTSLLYKKVFYLAVAIAAAVGNAMIYEASNRGTMVMCAMASLTVLLYCFGKKIEKLLPLIAIIGFLFVWSLFSYSTLGVRGGENFFDRPNYITELSTMAELYSNGVSTEAHAFDMYNTITSRMSLDTYISELIKSNNIFTLPGFWIVNKWVEAIPSIQKLFNLTLYGNAFILPNAGLAMYSVGWVLGWLLDIGFHIGFVKSIYFFYRKRKQRQNTADQYLYSYCEMICGFTLMNNMLIAVGLLSAMPFLLYILFKLNSLAHSRKQTRTKSRNDFW